MHSKTIFITLFFSIVTLLSSTMSQAQGIKTNQAAPDFTLPSMSNGNIKLSEYAGQVVLLNFWASWCAPCRKEMPLLNQLHNKYKKLGFSVIGVNVEENTQQAKSFMQKVPVDFPILFDSSNTVSKTYNVIAMPTTAIIDRNGIIRLIHRGYQSGDEKKYKKTIKKLIRE